MADPAAGADESAVATDVAEQPIAPVAQPIVLPSDLPAFLARRAPGSDPTVNTLTVSPQPIVQPKVRGWSQAQQPWGNAILRPPNHRGNPSGDLWRQAGCHPTCLAIVLRWWAEVNPETKGRLVFPFVGTDGKPGLHEVTPAPRRMPGEPDGLTPPELCRKLFGMEFALMRGVDNDLVNQRLAMQGVVLNGPLPGTEHLAQIGMFGHLLSFVRTPPLLLFESDLGSRDVPNRKRALKFLLQWGPLIVGLKNPSHFVVVSGFRGERLTVVDPGHSIVQDRWPGIANVGQALTIPTDVMLTERNGKKEVVGEREFVDNIHQVYLFVFDPTRRRTDWSA